MSKKLTQEEFIERVKKVHGEKYDYSLVKYSGVDNKVKIICNQHGVFEQCPSKHIGIQNQGCPKCAGKYKTINSLYELAIKKSGECLSKKYMNNSTKYLWSCKLKHTWYATSASIANGKWCPTCNGGIKKDYNHLIQLAFKNNGKCLSTHYVNTETKYIWKCNKNHKWSATANNIQQGRWCPKCKVSKGENYINNFLNNYEIDFIEQKWFPTCRNKWPLKFDFYLLKYNTCIEYDGEQHFICNGGWSNKKYLQIIKKNDQIKNKYCQENSINLIRIPFTEFKNIKTILQIEFEEGFNKSLNLSQPLHNKINSNVSIING